MWSIFPSKAAYILTESDYVGFTVNEFSLGGKYH